MQLVLSLFPGIGLLDMAFEEEGFCVVRGPDLLWGGDVRRFYPPAGKFDGVIGGPPCQAFSEASRLTGSRKENMIPEFERCIAEAGPQWFVMENVKGAPLPIVPGYHVRDQVLNNRWLCGGDGIGGEQSRLRRFSFGSRDGRRIVIDGFAVFTNQSFEPCVLASERSKGQPGRGSYSERRAPRSISRQAELMGLPPDFLKDAPFTEGGKGRVIGNGVPLAMGRAVARAVAASHAHASAEHKIHR